MAKSRRGTWARRLPLKESEMDFQLPLGAEPKHEIRLPCLKSSAWGTPPPLVISTLPGWVPVADSGCVFERQSRKMSFTTVTGLLNQSWFLAVSVGPAPAGPPLFKNRLPLVCTRPPKSKFGPGKKLQSPSQ